jgi:hypothetical protein
MACEHCGCSTDHTRPSMKDTETHCHCGAAYQGADHCPACGCEQYESLACFGVRDFDTSPRSQDDHCGAEGPHQPHGSCPGTTLDDYAAAEPGFCGKRLMHQPHGDCLGQYEDGDQVPGGPGPYTHIVRRESGYIAGWFVGEPPAKFIAECNASVPDDPAHAEQIPAWPDETRAEIDARPQTPGNPYTAYTPESRVWEIAQGHGQQGAAEAIAMVQHNQDGYRELLARIPELRSRPGVLGPEPKLRRDDLPGYALADLMSHAGWVPHDGTDLRDELASQYESQARIAFWNEVERRCLAALPHREVDNFTQLGNRFITCACGTRTSGGLGDSIAQRNFEHHLKRARESRGA